MNTISVRDCLFSVEPLKNINHMCEYCMSLRLFHATLPFIKAIKIPQWIWLHKKQCKIHIYHVTKDLANATELLK